MMANGFWSDEASQEQLDRYRPISFLRSVATLSAPRRDRIGP